MTNGQFLTRKYFLRNDTDKALCKTVFTIVLNLIIKKMEEELKQHVLESFLYF